MPQFYETDSLQCWIHSAISEYYETLEDDGKEYLLRVTESVKNLEQETEDLLHLHQLSFESSLYRAILNTIDFPELLVSLREQFEDELAEAKEPEVIYDKEAGIDKTDKMSRPDFFSIMADREKARKESKKCDGCGGSGTVAPTPSGKKLCDGCDSHFSTM